MLRTTCNKCGNEKDIDCFSINRARKDGRMAICKTCDCVKSLEWIRKNPAKVAAKIKKYRVENKDRLIQKDKEKYAKNKEKIIERVSVWSSKNRDKTRLYCQNNYKENKPKYMAKSAERRARKMNASPKWLSAIELAQIQEMYDVAIAKYIQTGIRYHVDHIHPLQGDGFNGLHVPWNLQVISEFENLSKGNKMPSSEEHLLWAARG